MPKIQFNHNKKISEYLKNKNGYDKRNHFIEITKIRNTRFTISYHLKFKFTGIKKNIQFVIPRNEESHQVIQIMRFLVPRNGHYPQ
ncbi:hypothetical protein FPG87_02640 [Flavobacterium psychrophilum]|uniref:hypothetical protein n=1 Tax=Flavobacterium psychrophilum TaxID=96345 RepID=UPI0006187AD2|nr:hypothetical protein [Flavobacterium psychrophilum]OAE92005.1 hypothetical protein SU65_09565 [Flavobacterium psychrophilum]OJH13098.1 hypothetical protein FPG87_02640 [Flavobacterium psychrophilum]SNA75985.1 hypothetical protein DK150_370018 [Flavobacterium psychrophilum]